MGGDYNYYIVCRTGTNSIAPKFELVKSKDENNNIGLGDKNTTNLYGDDPKIHDVAVTLVTK